MNDPFFMYKPTSMSYTAGDVASASYNHKSGVVLKTKLGERITGRQMSLVYKLQDNQILDFYIHYNSNLGTFRHFNLPSSFFGLFEFWCGTALNEDKTKRQLFTQSTKWHYAEPLKVRTMTRGWTELGVVLMEGSKRDGDTCSFVQV